MINVHHDDELQERRQTRQSRTTPEVLRATQHRRYRDSHAEQGSQCTPSPTIDYSTMPRKHMIVCDVNTRNFGSPPRKGVSQEITS
jgi:hypothetical protein